MDSQLKPEQYDQILQAVSVLASTHDILDVMRVVREVARDLSEADGVTFVLRDNGQCYYVEENAIAPLWKGKRFPMSACISGWCMLNKQAAVIEDIYADSRIPHDAYRETFVKSLVMVPVRRDAPVAAIGAYWAHRRKIEPDKVVMLQVLADSTAVALAKAQLYEELLDAKKSAERRFEEIEALLKEVHHRVKNNLQVISSLLRMQASGSIDDSARAVLHGSEARVRAMALVHERLYRSSSMSRVDFKAYLEDLVLNLNHSVAPPIRADVDLKLHAVSLDIDAAVPCGLLVNELITNCLTHAFKNGQAGKVFVSLTQQGKVTQIVIADNGCGLPANVDTDSPSSLGLQIVYTLRRQLNAQMAVERKEGTKFTITFDSSPHNDRLRVEQAQVMV